MAKNQKGGPMRSYETVFILKPTITAEEQDKHIQFYKENITNGGGEIIKVDIWGKQHLAYPIENHNEGIYVLIQFKADTEYSNNELEKRFKFNEDVLRYVIVMLDEKKFKQNPRKEPVKPRNTERQKAKSEENDEQSEAHIEEKTEEAVNKED